MEPQTTTLAQAARTPRAATTDQPPRLEQQDLPGPLSRIFRRFPSPSSELRIEAGLYPDEERPAQPELGQLMELRPAATPLPRGIRAGVALRYRFSSPAF